MMKNCFTTLLLLQLAFAGFAQNISYDVRRNFAKSVVKETLDEAKTIRDINPGYPSSWITGYISSEISTTLNGVEQQAWSRNDTLSQDQISLIKMADVNADIIIHVKCSPNNSSKASAEINELHFTYKVIPAVEASFPGGQALMEQYFKESVTDKIPQTLSLALRTAIVRFTVNEDGQISDAHISKSAADDTIDKVFLDAINNMPKWTPAERLNGKKVKQVFEFIIGNNIGC